MNEQDLLQSSSYPVRVYIAKAAVGIILSDDAPVDYEVNWAHGALLDLDSEVESIEAEFEERYGDQFLTTAFDKATIEEEVNSLWRHILLKKKKSLHEALAL